MRKTILLAAALMANSAFAGWQLDNDKSVVSFVSVKKEHIAENHTFRQLSGEIKGSGKVTLNIDLTSVDTNIPIRDKRMKEHLFNVAKFATATFSNEIDMKLIKSLAVGESKIIDMAGNISLHGQDQLTQFKAMVVKTSDNQLLVTSVAPVLIKAADFGLVAGIEKLKSLAGLPSIGQTVPVSFTLTYSK
jgi:polyisoprenoid-binding protein YceI